MLSIMIPSIEVHYKSENNLPQDLYTWDDVVIETNFERILREENTIETGYVFSVDEYLYTIGGFIAQGGSGRVFEIEIENIATSETNIAVIKIFHKGFGPEFREYENGFANLFKGNKYFVQILNSFSHEGYECIVMEKMDGCLFDIMGTLTSTMNAYLMKQLLKAFQFLEEKQVCHNDLKPETIGYLYNSGLIQIKILDFGLAERYGEVVTQGGTAGYVHENFFLPNVGVEITSAIDRWSLGCIFHEMITNELAFDLSYEDHIHVNHKKQVMAKLYNFRPERYNIKHSSNFSKLVLSCFIDTPTEELLESLYFCHFSI